MHGPRPDDLAVRAARELLGVGADAGPVQVARAYRSQARRLHPDVSLEPNATERFWALEAAYHLVLDVASEAVDPGPAEVPAPTAASRPSATGRLSRNDYPDPTVIRGIPLARGGRFPTSGGGRRRVAWLAVGPVLVQPPERPSSHGTPPWGEL